MIRTKITELCGIEHPIIGGAMAYLSDARLVGAISEAGALGVLASANYQTGEEFRAELRRVKAITSKPYAVNLNLFPMMRPIDNNDYLEILIEEGCGVVETSGHQLPKDLTSAIKAAGLTWIHKCVHPRHAQRAEAAGADAITTVGYENGGATGKWDIGTIVLVPTIMEAVKVPVIGGGGVADGRGLASLLALGAEGVIIGSRLVLAEECAIHENVRKLLIDSSAFDTTLVMRSIEATHRVIQNEAALKVQEIEARENVELADLLDYIAGAKSREVYFDGNLKAGMCYMSQGVGLMKSVQPTKVIIEEMMTEAEAIFARFQR
jgi:NADH:quinone reductase (non-electrogenic)